MTFKLKHLKVFDWNVEALMCSPWRPELNHRRFLFKKHHQNKIWNSSTWKAHLNFGISKGLEVPSCYVVSESNRSLIKCLTGIGSFVGEFGSALMMPFWTHPNSPLTNWRSDVLWFFFCFRWSRQFLDLFSAFFITNGTVTMSFSWEQSLFKAGKFYR